MCVAQAPPAVWIRNMAEACSDTTPTGIDVSPEGRPEEGGRLPEMHVAPVRHCGRMLTDGDLQMNTAVWRRGVMRPIGCP